MFGCRPVVTISDQLSICSQALLTRACEPDLVPVLDPILGSKRLTPDTHLTGDVTSAGDASLV
jgi:hypothetical protein